MTAPVLTDLDGVTFTEGDVNAAPRLIDGDVTFTDLDGDVAGGVLTVSGLKAEDVVSLWDQGAAAGQIGFDSGTGQITWGGIVVGTASGGAGGTFTVTFNGAATVASVEAVIEHLTYATESNHPSATRSLSINFTDAAGESLEGSGFSQAAVSGVSGIIYPTAVAVGDFDGDGDNDLIVLSLAGGGPQFLFNVGGPGAPALAVPSSGNAYFEIGYGATSAFSYTAGDFNGDGMVDLLVADSSGQVTLIANGDLYYDDAYYFFELPDYANPLHGQSISPGPFGSLTAVDFDGDGDLDLIQGFSDGALGLLVNEAGAFSTAAVNPFDGIDVGSYARVAVGDVDGDGDLDLVVGADGEALAYFENVGSEASPVFVERTGGANPFGAISGPYWASPTLADIDGDGLLDLVVVDYNSVRVFTQTGSGVQVIVQVTPEPGVIAVTGAPDAITFLENTVNATPQSLLGGISLSDDEEEMRDGHLLITSPSSDDLFGLIDQGMGAGQVGVDGAGHVYYGGLMIGAIGQSLGGYFSIDFADAPPGAVEAVLKAITYANHSDDPVDSTVTVTLSSGDYSVTRVFGIDLHITPEAEQVQVGQLATSLTLEFADAAGPHRLDAAVTFRDAEGDFDGGGLTVSGLATGDVVSIHDTGAGAGQIGFDGGTGAITYAGVQIGVASGGAGTTLSITFDADATPQAIEALIEALTFANAGADPDAHRTLTLTVLDAAGHALAREGAAGAPVTIAVDLVTRAHIHDLASAITIDPADAAGGVLLDASVTVTGAPADFSGGRLVISGLGLGDSIALQPGGDVTLFDDKGSFYIQHHGVTVATLAVSGGSATLSFAAGASPAAVEAVIEHLAYSNTAASPDPDRTLTFTLTDPTGASTTEQMVVHLAVAAIEVTVTDLTGSLTFTDVVVRATPQRIDGEVAFRDSQGDFDGGSLTVGGLLADDVITLIGIDTPAPAPGQVTFNAATGAVSVGGVLIGTATGGDGADFVITFNAAATSPAVDAVLQALAFQDTGVVSPSTRTLTIDIVDAAGNHLVDGADGAPVTIAVDITHTDLPPSLIGFNSNPSFTEDAVNSGPQLLHADVTFTAYQPFGAGSLTITGLGADDRITLLTDGSGPGQVGFDNETGEIRYGGVVIGAATGGNGAAFAIAFNASATGAMVEAVLERLAYANSSDTPSTASLQLTITDADGAQIVSNQGAFKIFISQSIEHMDLDGVSSTVTLGEQAVNAGPQVIDANVSFVGYSNDFAGQSLTVSGLLAEDMVTLASTGAVTYDAGTGAVSVGGVVIATATGGHGASFVITFNAAATSAAIDSVIEALAFANSSDSPTGSRVLSLQLTDRIGHPTLTSGGAPVTVTVNVTPHFDQMVLDGLIGSATFGEEVAKAGPHLLDASVTLFAPNLDVAGAVLAIGGLQADDVVTLIADGALGFDTGTGAISIGGVVVATATGGAGGAFIITFNAEATAADVETVVEHLAYANVSDAPAGQRTLTVQLTDADGHDLATAPHIVIDVTPEYDAMILTGVTSAVTFGEQDVNAGPQRLDASVDVAMPDANDFDGGTLTVSGLLAEDSVVILTEGLVAWDSGTGAVRYNGVVVGTTTGGDGAALTVTFNGDAALPAIEAVIEHLAYANSSGVPTADRTLTIQLTDADGVSLPSAVRIAVSVTAFNDAPTIGALAPVTFAEGDLNGAPQILFGDVTVTDPEGVIVQARVAITGIDDSVERIAIRDQGAGSGQVGYDAATGHVSWEGQDVGYLQDLGNQVNIFFTANVSRAVVEAVIQNITYASVSDAPPAARSLNLWISEAGSSLSYVQQQITITPQQDPMSLTGVAAATTLDEQAVNGGPQLLDASVTLTAPDNDLQGSTLVVSGLLAEDSVSVLAEGPVGYNAGTGAVSYGGVVIGAATGGAGASFTILFNGQATTAAIEAVIEHLAYANNSNTPIADRTLTIQLTDASGEPLTAAPQIVVSVTPFNDAPGVSGLAGVTFLENTVNATPQLLFGNVTVDDPEGVLHGARLSITNLTNGVDHIAIRDQGDGPGQVGYDAATGHFSWEGQDIGYIQDFGGQVNVFFTVDVSKAVVEAVIENITYANSSDTPIANHTVNLFISETGGGYSSVSQSITITPQYDPITLAGVTPSVTFGEQAVNAAPVLLDASVTLAAPDSTATRVVVSGLLAEDTVVILTEGLVAYDVGTGAVSYNGAVIGAATGGQGGDFGITFTGATAAQVEAVIEHLAYANASNIPTEARTLTIQVLDQNNVPLTSAPGIVVNVTAQVDPIVLSDVTASVTFGEQAVNAGPRLIDASVTLSAPDGNDFDGGTLTVGGLLAEDDVVIVSEGLVAWDAGTGAVRYNGVVIGAASGGDGATFVVIFNGDATLAAIEAVVEHLGYANASDTPQGVRTLTVQLTDADGHTLAQAVDIHVTPFHDAPVLSGVVDAVTVAETSAPALIDASVSLYARDSGFDGGSVTVAGVLAEDRVSILSEGLVAYDAGTGAVSYNGVVIGAATGGRGADFVITFDADATPAAVEAVIEHLTYADASNGPIAVRDLNIVVLDSEGASSTTTVTVNVTPTPDETRLSGLPGTATFVEQAVNTAPQLLYGDVSLVSDGFSGGTLTVSGLLAEDIVSIRNEGSGAGQIGFDSATGEVRYGGVVIGVATGGAGASFSIAFNAEANDLAVEAVIEHITYANENDSPALTRVLTLGLVDAHGAALIDHPTFTAAVNGAANPLDGYQAGNYGSVALADIDGDGDLDAITTSMENEIQFLENTGTAAAPVFVARGGADNPFAGISAQQDPFHIVSAAFGDLDGDGDLDMVLGGYAGAMRHLENVGTASAPEFVERFSMANPFSALGTGNVSRPALGDLDGDGDLDLVIGDRAGAIVYVENTGTAQAPVFAGAVQVSAPSAFDFNTVPALGDVDGDGDLDVLVGTQYGELVYFENTGGGTLVLRGGAADPFESISGTIGGFAGPALADLNGDGLIDLLVTGGGNLEYRFHLFPNATVTAWQTTVTVTPSIESVEIDGLASSVAFAENTVNAGPQLLDPDVSFGDIDEDMAGGGLTVSGLGSDDRVSTRHQGTGAGQIGFDAATGQITFGGVVIGMAGGGSGANLVITFSDGVTAAAVEALLENLQYANLSDTPAASRTLTIDIVDAAGHHGVHAIDVNVVAQFDPHHLDGLAASVTFAENDVNAGPQLIDSAVTLVVPETIGSGGTLVVSGLLAEDSVTLLPDGDGPGQIGFNSATGEIRYSGVVVGAATGGANGQSLSITYTAAVTPAAVEAIVEHLAFANDSETPTEARTLTLALTHESVTVQASVVVHVTDYIAPMTLTDLATAVTVSEGDANADGVLLDTSVTFSAPEGIASGTLRVTGAVGADLLYILDDGAGPGQVGVNGQNEISFGGVLIGTYSTDYGFPLTVSFNANATAEALEAVLERLAYRTASDYPAAERTLTVQITNANGETLVSAPQVVLTVTPQVDPIILNGLDASVTFSEDAVNLGPQALDASVALFGSDGWAGGSIVVGGLLPEDVVSIGEGPVVYDSAAGTLSAYNAVFAMVAGGHGEPLVITLTENDPAAVYALMSQLTYANVSDEPTASRTLTIQVTDTNGQTLGSPAQIVVNVTPDDEHVVLTGLAPSVTFVESALRDGPQVVDSSLTLTDPDQDFNGGVLRVTGLTGHDRVSVLDEGSGAGQVGYDAATRAVSYGGVVIGAASGGVGAAFTVTFNGAATAAAVEAVMEHIAFANGSATPVADRTLTFDLTDAAGHHARAADGPATFQVQVHVTDEPTVPTLRDFASTVTAAGGTPTVLDRNVTYEDERASFAGVTLTVTGLSATDNLTLKTPGSGPTVIHLDGGTGEVLWGSIVIGTAVGGDGGDFVVTFNASATRQMVEQVIERLAWSSDAPAPGAVTTLAVGLHEAGGAQIDVPHQIVVTTAQTTGLPSITLSGEDTVYENDANAGVVPIDLHATVADPEGDFAGGYLAITSGWGEDDLSIIDHGTSAGQIGFNAATGAVTFGGVVIGQIEDLPTGFRVLFNANATTQAVQALTESVGYTSTDNNPYPDRVITVEIVDGAGESANPVMTHLTGSADPLNAFQGTAPYYSAPNFVDIDADGDLDVLFTYNFASLAVVLNTGTADHPVYATLREPGQSPWSLSNVGGGTVNNQIAAVSAPADLDGDGDYDLVVAGINGTLRYYENTGTASNAGFVQRTGAANPFDGITLAGGTAERSPALGDLDGDGDLDMIVGLPNGQLRVYENVGDAQTPVFALASNSLSSFTIFSSARPALVDYDGDGDLDIIVKKTDATLTLLENLGGGDFAQTALPARFNGITQADDFQTYADIDNDGDLDLLASDFNWYFTAYTAQGPTRVQTFDTWVHLVAEDEGSTFIGDAGDNTLTGGAGVNRMKGLGGNDILNGGLGADWMMGGTGNDTYFVDNLGDATIELAGGGTDEVQASLTWTLSAEIEKLTLTGGGAIGGTGNALRNTITGNTGANLIDGGGEADTLLGGNGDDYLLGGTGADQLFGENNNDRLEGGAGNDQLTGGLGADTFAFTLADMHLSSLAQLIERDMILDLNFAQGDRIDLSGIDGDVNAAGDQALSWALGNRFSKHAGELVLKYAAATNLTTLEIDVDGDGKADFRIAITGDQSGTTGNLFTGAGDLNGGWIL